MIATVNLEFAADIPPILHIVPQGYDLSSSTGVLEIRNKDGVELYPESSDGITVVTITLDFPLQYPDGTEIAAGEEVLALRVAPDLSGLDLDDPDNKAPEQYRYGLRVDDAWTLQGWWTIWPDTGPARCNSSPIAICCGPVQVAVTVASGPRGEQGLVGPAGPWQAESRRIYNGDAVLSSDTLVYPVALGGDIAVDLPDPGDLWDGSNAKVIVIARIITEDGVDDGTVALMDGLTELIVLHPLESVIVTTNDQGVSLTVSDSPFIMQDDGGGSADAVVQTALAAEVLSGHRIVYGNNGLRYSDKDDLATVNSIVGMTLTSAVPGSQVSVVSNGLMQESTWDLSYPVPVFLGNDGQFVQIAPTSGALVKIGSAISATQILINIEEPIILSGV